MSGTSNVGGPGVYEAGDQRNVKDSEVNDRERYKEGQPNSHVATDSSMLPSQHLDLSQVFSRLMRFLQRMREASQISSLEKRRYSWAPSF